MDDLKTRQDVQEPRPLRRAPVAVRAPVRRRAVWIVLGLLVVIGLAWWIYERPARVPAGRFGTGAPMPVVAATAAKGDVNIIFNALGTVTPLATVTVKTQINGQLVQIAFQEGQEVKKGDFLAQIDPRPYQAALDQAQGQLAHDQALLQGAQIDLARYQKLAAQNSIAKQQADDQLYLVQQYEGTVRVDQAQVDNAKLNLGYCHIVAPASGVVGLRQVDQGNYVQVSDASGIVVITQMQPISVIFTLPEDNLPAVLKQVRSGATLQATAFDRSGSIKLATGKLLTMNNQIDTTTGTMEFRALFDNPDENLIPNQFVNIQLLVDVQHDATVIPPAAIQRGAPGTFVYLVKSDDTVAVQPIKLGPADVDRVAVQSGLTPGDQVVVDGADKLRDGAKISLRTATGASAPGTSASGASPAPANERRSRNSQ